MADTEHNGWESAARDNREVYSGFVGLAKWGTILISIVLILMANLPRLILPRSGALNGGTR